MHTLEVFQNYQHQQWRLNDIPWDRIQKDRVLPEYIDAAKSAVMGECTSIAAVQGFLNDMADDYDFSAYACLWGYQELQHHYVFRTWLTRLGIDVETLPIDTMRPPYPPGITRAATLATNVISELTVCHVYHTVSQHVQEAVLQEILRRVTQDEARHAREFQYFTDKRLRQCPEELSSVLETLYVYVADPDYDVKHPVSVLKGNLPELAGQQTIEDGLAYFKTFDTDSHSRDKLRKKIVHTFSALTGFELDSPASIRKALRESWKLESGK